MKKAVLGGGLLLIIIFGLVFFVTPKETSAPTHERAEEVGYAFIQNVVKKAEFPEDNKVAVRLHDALSSRAQGGVRTETLLSDILGFVGIQDVPDLGVSVEDLQILDKEEAVLTVRLSYSGESVLRNIHLMVEGGVWKVDRVSVVEEGKPESQVFDKRGVLVKNNPGMEEGLWYFVYEETASPALSRILQFLPRSMCTEKEESYPCNPELLEQGRMVRLRGLQVSGDVIEVVYLEYIETETEQL